MTLIRVRFHLNRGSGEYQVGLCYDVTDTNEIRALISAGLADLIPYDTVTKNTDHDDGDK